MLRVFTAFSGYDSQCLALNVLRDKWSANKVFNQDGTVRYGIDFDYELVGWSEIVKIRINMYLPE